MKSACIILTVIILVAIMAVCVMVKFATDITVEERTREYIHGGGVHQLTKSMGIIALKEDSSAATAERFPYVAAITRNSSSSWSFACFASVILIKWVVTSAHCRQPGSTHRVLVYHDFTRNLTHTYLIILWRLHEKFNISNPTPKYDIAVAKLNIDLHPFSMKPSVFDEKIVNTVEASIWKTVSTMDKKMYLTNDFQRFTPKLAAPASCFESYGVEVDETLICIDMSDYEDCFIYEFGPIYFGDKVVGVLAVKPRECDMKFAVFTNVSYYTNWILKVTHTAFYG